MPSRTSDNVKQLRGTQRPDRGIVVQPHARLKTAPPAPLRLTERGRQEWAALAADLVALGTLRSADLRALELLAATLASIAAFEDSIAKDGLTTAAGRGGLKAHPGLAALGTARGQARAMLSDFGLSPRARQGVDAVPPGSQESPYAEFKRAGA